MKNVFCSHSCAAKVNKNGRFKKKRSKTERFHLRTYMDFEGDGQPIRAPRRTAVLLTLQCEGCGALVVRSEAHMRKSKHGKPYCSKSCRMRHYNAHILPRSSCHRSEPEDMLIGLIRAGFPDLELLPNDRTTLDSHLEIDIYLPTIPLAIELNGPVHYLPIYGDERLAKVQTKDSRKHLELHQRGIALLVLDISKLKSKKQQRAFIEAQYAELVRPLIMEAREGVSPSIA